MSFYINNEEPKEIFYNGQEVKTVYYNGELVWGVDDSSIVFYSADGTDVGVNFSFTVDVPGLSLYYSLDGSTWKVYNTGTNVSGKHVYIRGAVYSVNGILDVFNGYGDGRFILTGTNICCEGNLEALYHYDRLGEHITHDKYFSGLFLNQENLIKAPKLSLTTLTTSCYERMFQGCTNLKEAPELPATSLADSCYARMFQGCTSLTQAPELPATSLASGCYYQMFSGCTGLTIAPELPATTLASGCYYGMFENCSSLITINKIPSGVLIDVAMDSCERMYSRCSSIKLSETKTTEYTQPYSISDTSWVSGASLNGVCWLMFDGTGGTFTGTPTNKTIYYIHKDCEII